MEIAIQNKLIRMDPATRAALVGRIRQYVTNAEFVNLFANLDVNDHDPKNRNKVSNLYFICAQTRAFNGVPGVPDQVSKWLHS